MQSKTDNRVDISVTGKKRLSWKIVSFVSTCKVLFACNHWSISTKTFNNFVCMKRARWWIKFERRCKVARKFINKNDKKYHYLGSFKGCKGNAEIKKHSMKAFLKRALVFMFNVCMLWVIYHYSLCHSL